MQRNQKSYEEPMKLHDTEQTKEEFYKWFENRGLLTDLRAYMRQLMAKALADSNKRETTLQQKKTSSSPKLQAINLLVVDYLFHEDYLYTVSVFSSEAHILDSLPQYSQYVTETVREQRWDPRSLPRFSRQEAEDILDTLHLPSSPLTMCEAVNLYLSGTESLFTCVVRILASSFNQSLLMEPKIKVTEGQQTEVNYELWSKEMQDLLLMAGVKLQHIQRLQQRWSKIIEEEKLKVKKKTKDEEVKVEEEEIKQRLKAELEEEMSAEHQELRERQSKVELRERGLANLANQLSAVNEDINHRLSELQLQKDELQMRETHHQHEKLSLENQLRQLQTIEKQEYSSSSFQENSVETPTNDELHQKHNNQEHKSTKEVCTQTENIINVNETSTQTSDPGVTIGIQTANRVDSEQQTSQEIQSDNQNHLQREQEKISELLEENLELRAHALQQRQRIDELTNRAASISAQLEESRVAVTVLSGREDAQVANPAPPPPPFMAHPQIAFVPTFGFNTPQRAGAGEEALFGPRPPQTNSHPDHRRRSLRFSFSQNPSLTSEESSHTDEVIQNARSRIRQLEEESAVVQRNYQAFQSRLLASDSFMYPPLGAHRVNNSVVRIRRPDRTSFVPFTNHPYSQVGSLRFRQPESQEDNENSSSDHGGVYETSRIESLTNTRRLFTQRNLRQFERWKQFKKKFQRRDATDQTRRNMTKQPLSNSSSEDENIVHHIRHRRERSRTKRVYDKSNLEQSNDIRNQPDLTEEIRGDVLSGTKKVEEKNVDAKLKIGENCSVDSNLHIVENGTINNRKSTTVEKVQNEKDTTLPNLSISEQSTRRSAELIESLKILLGDHENQHTFNLSEGSLILESSSRDCNKLNLETNQPYCLNTSIESNKIKTLVEIKKYDDDITNLNVSKTNNQDEHKSFQSDLDIQKQEDNIYVSQDTNLEPLVAPSARLFQNKTIKNEALKENVAERTTGEKALTETGSSSVTSGSDILRELNSPNTESTTSVSVGLADSRRSSDFWE